MDQLPAKRFNEQAPMLFHVEPGRRSVRARKEAGVTTVELPPLTMHALLVGEY
jgi:hypothetical protein